jgi:hypothetical protein
MTPRSLFTIILKCLGVFFIKDFLLLIPQLLTVFLYFMDSEMILRGIWVFLATVVQLAIYFLVFYFLIFKTDRVIDKLHLEKGFSEENFAFNVHRAAVLTVIIIITGILIIVNAVPTLCKQLFLYIQELQMSLHSGADITKVLAPAAQLIIGLILIGSHRQIVNFIERKRRNTVIENEQI